MNEFKNVDWLVHISPDEKEKIEYAAREHKRHSSITFKVVSYQKKAVIIQVAQAKNAQDVYQNAKRLVEIVHETFDRFFPGFSIKVQPIPYKEPPVNAVTPEWINKKMLETGTRLKDIAADTGIANSAISGMLNDHRALSQVTKAMFWYYFKSKK